MTVKEEKKQASPTARGGGFLIRQAVPEELFTPEDLTDEHRAIADLCDQFITDVVMPQNEAIEHLEAGLMPSLVKKAGDAGLLSAEIPTEYGGMGLDETSAILICEHLGRQGSFAVSHGAHSGIGTLPIVYFGTPEQKKKYLPKLGSGELLSCYALTEPGSGSDALAAKTKAVLSTDGKHYILNGSKMWITNAGFADICVLFAKIDGDKFTGFIIERNMPGFTVNKEERKMGLKGSSTCALTLKDVKVPVENLLGEISRGHKIAFNILNIGRFKLGAGALGAAKEVLRTTLAYTQDRKQFDTRIADFPLIMSKLADMAVKICVGESMVYRTAGLIDGGRPHAATHHPDPMQERLAAIEEYAVECSMLKVGCSEILDFVVDEGVQCHGGYGYSAEYPVERFYRDSRINRIFEGTNEINRMLIPGMLIKRAMKGELPLLSEVAKVQQELLDAGGLDDNDGSLLSTEKKLVEGGRKLALLMSGVAFQAFGEEMKSQQEVLAHIADLCITLYGAESVVVRALKCAAAGSPHAKLVEKMARIAVNDAAVQFEQSAKAALPAMVGGDELKILLSAVKRLTRFTPVNAIALRHEVAQELKQAGRYFL